MSSVPNPSDSDVRMRGFARRTTVEAALAWLDCQLKVLSAETVDLDVAAGRVLAESITSPIDVPLFNRAMMDGFALRAGCIEGATPYNRLPLTVVGQAFPGRAFEGTVGPGQAVRIMTGAPLPAGADAVLPAEVVEGDGRQIFALADVSQGRHVGRRGEDVSAGTALFSPGRRLRPQDLGVLSSIGAASVQVVRKPRVAIVATGSELLRAGSTPYDYKIANANGPMLSALVSRDGGLVTYNQIVCDDRGAILSALSNDADVTLVSGGSSVGQEDHVPSLVAQHGELAIHGVAMRPSSPAGMGYFGGRLVFLLPGNPVSCMCAYDFFAGRALRALGGRPNEWPYRAVRGVLARKISSVIGRVDYARVKLNGGQIEPLSIGGASILSSTTRADGFAVIAADSEGYPAGADIEMFLYD